VQVTNSFRKVVCGSEAGGQPPGFADAVSSPVPRNEDGLGSDLSETLESINTPISGWKTAATKYRYLQSEAQSK